MSYDDKRLTYNDSCFIINAIDYYIALFKSQECNLSDEGIQHCLNIKKKYEKLENQILELRIKDK